MYLYVRGKEGVEVGESWEVQGNDFLEQQYITELHFEAEIVFAQDSHKAVFPGVDGPFGCVPLMRVGRILLIIDSLVVEEGNECVVCLVFQDLKAGAETTRG